MILLHEDAIALKYLTIYYGLPRYGHPQCFLDRDWPLDHSRVEQVTRQEPDIEIKYCSGCGKPLIAERGASDD